MKKKTEEKKPNPNRSSHPDTGSTPCFDVKADIVFVVDESGSVQREDHQQLLYFMDKVTQALDVGLDKVRVGAMSFSGEPRLWFYLNRYDNKTDMLDRIMRERYTQGGSTYTGVLSCCSCGGGGRERG